MLGILFTAARKGEEGSGGRTMMVSHMGCRGKGQTRPGLRRDAEVGQLDDAALGEQ